MAQPYPISRESREEAIFFGDGGAVYGPFALKIFDIDDVEVWTKADGGTWTIAAPTVAKVDPAIALDEFTITFAAVVPVTTKIKVLSARVHERSAGITAGTKLSPDALEKELTKQGTILQELRRDIGRALKMEYEAGASGLAVAAVIGDGHALIKEGNRLVEGPDAAQIASAEANGAIAVANALIAAAYANNQMVFDTSALAAAAEVPVITRLVRLNGGAARGDGYGGLFTDTDNGGAIAFTSSGTTARNWYRVADVELVRLAGVENYSMPTAVSFAILYVKASGTDTTGGSVRHGQTEATAFATSDAALLHAKKYIRFTGRLNVVMLKFAQDGVRDFNLGSNLIQGDEGFPFTIAITSIDNADRAQFDSITCGSWRHTSLYVTQVELAYCGATRLNLMRVNDVTIRAKRDELNNPVSLGYCFYSAFGSFVHVFGTILIKEPVVFTSAFFYCQQRGNIMLENGDSPSVFPAVVIVNVGNITSPYKYRAVFGSYVYCPSNVYPQLTYAANYFVDASSFSTQTQWAEDLGKNAASGGPCVADSGNTAAGWRLYADGYCEQWGTETLTGLVTGRTNLAATITFAKELISGSYIVEGSTNNMDVRIGLHGVPLTTGFPMGAFNHNAAAQSATARWRVCGYIA